MSILTLVLYAVIGIFAGFSGGLLGIGGGLVAVPCLHLLFQWQGFPPAYTMHLAIGTSLAAMIFTSGSSALAHSLKKGVYWYLFLLLTPGVIVGSIFGALVADSLKSRELELIFGVCECLIGAYFLSTQTIDQQDREADHPSLIISFFLGIIIGSISTILGIGGGVITVPILTAYRLPIRNAISTSAVIGFIIALFGAASFLLLGFEKTDLHGAVGYVYLPAFIAIGIVASAFAPLGAKLAYTLPTKRLRQIFGIFLLIIGIYMVK